MGKGPAVIFHQGYRPVQPGGHQIVGAAGSVAVIVEQSAVIPLEQPLGILSGDHHAFLKLPLKALAFQLKLCFLIIGIIDPQADSLFLVCVFPLIPISLI